MCLCAYPPIQLLAYLIGGLPGLTTLLRQVSRRRLRARPAFGRRVLRHGQKLLRAPTCLSPQLAEDRTERVCAVIDVEREG